MPVPQNVAIHGIGKYYFTTYILAILYLTSHELELIN